MIKTLTLTKEDGSTASYELKSLGRTFTQKLDNKAIQKVDENDDVLKDLLFILCHGSKIEEFKKYDTFGRCKLGEFAGNESKLKDFLSKQYINVSRQTTGKTSVDLGSIAQRHVRNKIETYFSNNNRVSFEPGNRIPGFSVEDPEVDTQFDIVLRVQKTRQATTFVAIEVAFQETTNSVIERKARQALARFREIENRNYYILYVIDGGGWFARKNSIKKILDNSHLSVSISDNDIVKLCKYVEDIVQ